MLSVSEYSIALQQTVHGCLQPKYRRAQPDQLQHSLRVEDTDDDLSRHGPTRLHGFSVDHRQLDAQAVRKVSVQISSYPRA